MFSITIGNFTFYDVKIVDFSTIKKGDIITLGDFNEGPNAVDATCEAGKGVTSAEFEVSSVGEGE